MPYIIDGHNLIPKIPGLSLEAIDDEQKLIELLQDFCRRRRKRVEVYFDNAPPGGMRVRKLGVVTARFVRSGQTADDAIKARLKRMGRSARNWTVVSSDRMVQASARAARARVEPSELFSRRLLETLDERPQDREISKGDEPLSPEDIQTWLDIFGDQDEGQ
jgi:predicted RNA-binding protein with PIN domain